MLDREADDSHQSIRPSGYHAFTRPELPKEFIIADLERTPLIHPKSRRAIYSDISVRTEFSELRGFCQEFLK